MSMDIFNILDLIRDFGEKNVQKTISAFQCTLNTEIESFLLKDAIEFSKKKISITYLLIKDNEKILAYFTLTHKPTLIPIETLSKTTQKHLSRFAVFKEDERSFSASAFLIAQFGKNTQISKEEQISGKSLMKMAMDILLDVQHRIGGGIVFLECEDNSNILKFYCDNNFKPYAIRNSQEKITYHQMLCVI